MYISVDLKVGIKYPSLYLLLLLLLLFYCYYKCPKYLNGVTSFFNVATFSFIWLIIWLFTHLGTTVNGLILTDGIPLSHFPH
jgi:hypothetical protein